MLDRKERGMLRTELWKLSNEALMLIASNNTRIREDVLVEARAVMQRRFNKQKERVQNHTDANKRRLDETASSGLASDKTLRARKGNV